MKKLLGIKPLLAVLALAAFGCTSGNDSNGTPDYLGSWDSEIPQSASVSMAITDANGQPQTLTINGEITVSFDALDDGSVDLHFHFDSTDDPACIQYGFCSMDTMSYRQHEYLGRRFTQEGLRASLVRVTNEDTDTSSDGFMYVSENRLCVSYALLDMFQTYPDTQYSDPLAIYFDHCYVKNTSGL